MLMQRLNFMIDRAPITPWKITSSLTSNVSIDMSKDEIMHKHNALNNIGRDIFLWSDLYERQIL